MRFKTVTSAVAISAALALAACGQDQTAEAPPADQQGQVAQTQPAPPPPGADAPPATAGAPATEGEVTVVEPAQPAPQQDQMAQTAPGAAPGAADQTGALPTDVGEEVQPGRYQSGDLALELTPDGSFMLMGADGQQVTGQYNLFGDTLTLTNVQNAPPDAPFPMTCTVEPEGQGFRVIADAQSCAMLDGQIFQPAG